MRVPFDRDRIPAGLSPPYGLGMMVCDNNGAAMTIRVLIAETATGKVLHLGGTRHQAGDAECRIDFDSVASAFAFCEDHVRSFPDRECVVYGEDADCLRTFRA